MAENGYYGVQTKNRFEILQERENDNRHLANHMDISRQDFINSCSDDKLKHIFDELRFIRNEQVGCSRGILTLQQIITNMDAKVGQVIQTTNEQTEFLKALAYKSIDIEARSRRNNLIFRGNAENPGENCTDIISNFLENRLDIDSRDVNIGRARRLGARTQTHRIQSRPIIVNIQDYRDTEYVMGRARWLKNLPF